MFKRILAALSIGACCATVSLATVFTWVAGGADNDWDTCDNWSPASIPQECYPSTWSDDVVIPYTANGWAIDLITETIDDVSIAASVDFGSAGGTPTLSCETFVISAASGEVSLTMSGATLSVTGPV